MYIVAGSSLNPGGYEEEEDEEEDEQDEDFLLSMEFLLMCILSVMWMRYFRPHTIFRLYHPANKPKVTVEMCLDKIVEYAQNLPLSQVFFSRFQIP